MPTHCWPTAHIIFHIPFACLERTNSARTMRTFNWMLHAKFSVFLYGMHAITMHFMAKCQSFHANRQQSSAIHQSLPYSWCSCHWAAFVFRLDEMSISSLVLTELLGCVHFVMATILRQTITQRRYETVQHIIHAAFIRDRLCLILGGKKLSNNCEKTIIAAVAPAALFTLWVLCRLLVCLNGRPLCAQYRICSEFITFLIVSVLRGTMATYIYISKHILVYGILFRMLRRKTQRILVGLHGNGIRMLEHCKALRDQYPQSRENCNI